MDGIARFHADLALQLANERIHEQHVASARARMASRNGSTRVGSLLAAIRMAFTTPARAEGSPYPRLSDYPFRS
jgi:hypothetical protein